MAGPWRGAWRWIVGGLALAPMPAMAATTIRQLVERPTFSGLVASPDGRQVAVRVETADVAANRYRLEWLVIDPATGQVAPAGDGGDAIYADPGLVEPGEACWAPDGSSFYYRALADGAIGLWRSASTTSPARLVHRSDGNIERLVGVEGQGVTYLVGPARSAVLAAELAEDRQGVRVDASVDLAQSLMRGGWIDGRLGTQRLAGRWFKREGLLANRPRERRRFDPATGVEALIGVEPVPPPPTGPVRPPDRLVATAADGATAIVSDVKGQSLVHIDRGSRKAEWRPDGKVAWFAWAPDGELVMAVRDRHKRDRLFAWGLSRRSPRAVAAFDGTLSGGGYSADRPCALARHHFLCIAAGPLSPPRLVSIGRGNGRQLAIAVQEDRRAQPVAKVTRLEWQAGTAAFTGVLVTPAGEPGRRPLVLTYYRCLGWLKGGEGGEWPTLALVEAGLAVACINAAPDDGPQDALANYRVAEAGIRALVARLDAEGIVDPRRIGMGGFSFGSEVTTWMLTHSSLIKAASIASPQIEPAYYWFNAGRGRDQPGLLHQVWGLGPPETTAARWDEVAAVRSTDRIGAALLLQLPEQEARQMPELLARISRSAVPSEIYAFPDEGHIKVQPAHQWQVMQRNLDWFRFWLMDATDLGDPEAAERWRLLRTRGADPLPAG